MIDDRGETFIVDDTALIQKLCDRKRGIGADGLILLQESYRADFSMRIFNSDGREAEMCGNGLRCLSAFLRDLGLVKGAHQVFVSGKIYDCSFQEDNICVQMGKVQEISWNISLCVSDQELTAHYLNTGVPHAVIFVDDIFNIDVERVGKEVRWHPIFQPKGVNVNFVSERSLGMLTMRTFERGIERETLACGTGAVAVAFAANKLYGYSSPMKIFTTSQEMIEIRLPEKDKIEMLGGATFVFKGHIANRGVRCFSV